LLPYVALAVAFLPYVVWQYRIWGRLPLEHTLTCILALPMAAGLAWIARDPEAVAAPDGGKAWRLMVIGGLFLHAVALLTGLSGLSGAGLPLALAGVVLRTEGTTCLQRMGLPIAFLVFLLPLPWLLHDAAALPAQQASATVAFLLLVLTPMDVMLQGIYVYTKEFYVLVNDTCSGLSSACALVMLAMVAAQLRRLSMKRAAILIVVVLPIGLVTNGARIAFLLFMGHYFGIEWASGPVHDGSALLFFSCAYVALFWGARRLALPADDLTSAAITASSTQEKTSPAV
jgi:exosortase